MASPADERCDVDDDVTAWAASGAMALTGWPGRAPLGPPSGLVRGLRELGDALTGVVALDPVSLLAERAAITGLTRRGDVSCGGATRLLPIKDRWLAVSLARVEDIDLVPAWLGLKEAPADPWVAITRAAQTTSPLALEQQAAELGLPVGLLARSANEVSERAHRTRVEGAAVVPTNLADLVVVDLTALWAGPLCGSLLAAGGATVIKVESTGRPDGGRLGPPAFFDLLNAGKQSVAVDLSSREGVAALRRLLLSSDVVIEASRPRALEQLGIGAAEIVATGRTRVWASITGHGRSVASRNRVAFGDDAAVAGGLVCWADGLPVFCADAIADPLTGLFATTAIIDALASSDRVLLDIAMAGVAASLGGPTLPVPDGVPAAPPHARAAHGRAPLLGEHTNAVLAGLL